MYAVLTDVGGDLQFDFRNSVFARKMSLPATWTKLRAAILFNVENNIQVGFGIPNINCALGFSAGVANVFGDPSVGHFVGAIGDVTDDLAYASAQAYQGGTILPGKKVGTTKTTGTALALNNWQVTTYNSYLSIDITKGAPNYTFNLLWRSAINSGSPPTEADFINDLKVAVPARIHHAYSANQTVAVDEAADGTLDSFNFYWGHSAQLQVLMFGAVAFVP